MKTNFRSDFEDLQAVLFIRCALLFITLIFNVSLLVQSPKAKKTAKPVPPRVSVREAEEILSRLGYWITKVDDAADVSTRHAITAFQKVEGRARTGILTAAELKAMRAARRPVSRFTGDA